jgi:flagellar motor switch protein FliN/FliY
MNSTSSVPPNLHLLLDIPMQVSVELGTCQMPMRQVLALKPGSVIQLDRAADAPVDLYVNDKLVARGQVVVLDDRFGIKVTELIGK